MSDGSRVPAKTETTFSWIRTRLNIERRLMCVVAPNCDRVGRFGLPLFSSSTPPISARRSRMRRQSISVTVTGYG